MKSFLITLLSFFILDINPFFYSSVNSEELKKEYLLEKNFHLDVENFNNQLIKNNFYLGDVSKEFFLLKNNFVNYLIATKLKEESYSLSIEADTKYIKGDIFYAEGNVIAYFGDFKLKADKIKFDKTNKIFTANENIIFNKGSQYFEASRLEYNLQTENGFIENIYGVLDLRSFSKDLNFQSTILNSEDLSNQEYNQRYDVSDLEYINSTTLGLVNDFEEDKKFNITDLELEIPTITKWRFKSKKILIKSGDIESKQVFFTNDVYNQPQFLLESNNFSAKIIEDKLDIISRNSWIKLDNKLNFPIGRRTINDRDPITRWGIGSDYGEKDGLYISRGFDNIELNDIFNLRIQPYYLIQRSIRGNTESFRARDSSLFSEKVKDEITFSDVFALDYDLIGIYKGWNIKLTQNLNSLNTNRLSESLRSKLTFIKSINLQESAKNSIEDLNLKEKNNTSYESVLDLKFTNSFREEVSRGYAGESEIYFGNAFSVANKLSWESENVKNDISFLYDIGEFKARARGRQELTNLFRHVLAATYENEYPLLKINGLDKNINETYKYSSKVIDQGIKWKTNIKAGTFIYSDNSNQNAISIASGPEITLGSFKGDFLDYTQVKIHGNYALKNGQSPFVFDNIDDTLRFQFNLEQQILGALVFKFETFLNLDEDEINYGEFEKSSYGLDFRRRAYNIGAYYKPKAETFGIQFQIFNFNYSGNSKKF